VYNIPPVVFPYFIHVAAGLNSDLQSAGNVTGKIMGHSNIYDSADTVIDYTGRNPVFPGDNYAGTSDTNAPYLNSRELLTRFDEIRGLYDSAKTPAGKKRLRKEAHSIKHLIGDHRRKVYYSAGSVVMAIALLIIILQNIGLI
jgi:hypothetical protein